MNSKENLAENMEVAAEDIDDDDVDDDSQSHDAVDSRVDVSDSGLHDEDEEAEDIYDDDEEDVPLAPPVDISERIKQFSSPAASPAFPETLRKSVSEEALNDKTAGQTPTKTPVRRKQLSDSWIDNSGVDSERSATPEGPSTVSDGEEDLRSPIDHSSGNRRRSRKLRIPSWINDEKNLETTSNDDFPQRTSPSNKSSRRSVRNLERTASLESSSTCSASGKDPEEYHLSPSVRKRRMRGRRVHGTNSWIKKDTEENETSQPASQDEQRFKSSERSNDTPPGSRRNSNKAVPSSISYSEEFDQDAEFEALKDDSDDLTKTPIPKRRTPAAMAAYVASTPGSNDRSRSGRSLRSYLSGDNLSVDRSVDTNDTLFGSDEVSTDDGATDDAEALRLRLVNKKDRIERMRAKAKERMHQMQAQFQDERGEWKAALVELERTKRDRDRLLQDQAQERALLEESQNAVKRKQEDLNKIQKTLELDNICKVGGATEGAKTALDLQARIEAMVQENRRLQHENERLTEQQAVSKEHSKQREFFVSDEDADESFPTILLNFLQATSDIQKEVTDHIAAVVPDASCSSHDSIESNRKKTWSESQGAVNEVLLSSHHATAIEKVTTEIQVNCSRQVKALYRLKKEHQTKLENMLANHANEVAALTKDIETLEDRNTQRSTHSEETIRELNQALEGKESELQGLLDTRQEIDRLKAFLESKNSQILQLQGEIDATTQANETTLQQIEEWKIQNEAAELTIKDLRAQLSVAQSDFSITQEQRGSEKLESERIISSLQAEIETKREESQPYAHELDEVRTILKQRKEQVMSLKKDLRDMKQQIADQDDRTEEIKSLRNVRSEMELNLTSLTEEQTVEKRKHEAAVVALYDEIEQLKLEQIELIASQVNATELEAAQKELMEERSRHTNEIESLRADYTELECNLVDAGNKIKDLESNSKAELEETMELVERLQNELLQINSNHEGLKHEIGSMKKECLDLEETKNQCEEKILGLEQQIASANNADDESASGKLKKENEVLQQALEKIASEYQGEIDSLRDTESTLMAKNTQQKQEIESLETKILERSLLSASQAKDTFETAAEQKPIEEWDDVNERFESLNDSFSERNESDENYDHVQSMKELEEKFQHLRVTSQKQEAYLMETVRRQKVSIDSMYGDLVFAKDQVTKFKTMVADLEASPGGLSKDMGMEDSALAAPSASSPRPGDDEVAANQSDMLSSIIDKQVPAKQRSSTTFRRLFGSGSRRTSGELDGSTPEHPVAANAALEEKCRKLEEDNQELRSSMVKVQSQYKEESYKYKKAVEELQLANEAVTLKNIALIDAVDQTYDQEQDDNIEVVDKADDDGGADDGHTPPSSTSEDSSVDASSTAPSETSSAKIMRV
ncbi:MAG: hypothetical protein SGILL_002397 [Bacillariaceae sp.]